jgi:hypothetical protein
MPGGGQISGAGGNSLSPVQAVAISGATVLVPGLAYQASVMADYAATLPPAAANAGRVVSISLTNASDHLLTLTGNGAELIDGQNTRIMWAGESATLLCDGIGWTKTAGKSIPFSSRMRISSAQLNLAGSFAENIILLSTVDWNYGGIANSGANRFTTKRASRYIFTGFIQVDGTSFGASLGRLLVSYKLGAAAASLMDEECNILTGQYASPDFSRTISIGAGVDVALTVQVDIAAATTDISSAVAELTELISW